MLRDKREDIPVEVAHLRDLDLDGLKQRWRALFGRSAASHIPKHILLRVLAYRVQAEALGDVSRITMRLLDSIARTPDGNDLPTVSRGGLRQGTVLIREHEGKRHHVMVAPEGFTWNGNSYPSLSKVAFAITGTKWNGPRFFGLREKCS